MKKTVLGLACLIGIMSCGLDMPGSITIKGKPGTKIPMGSPFTEENNVAEQFSPEKIMEMMGEDAIVYNYQDANDPKVQAYIVRYEIIKDGDIDSGALPPVEGGLPTIEPIENSASPIAITNGLRDYLGENVAYKKVEGYIYIQNIKDAGMSMKNYTRWLVPATTPPEHSPLIHQPRPPFPPEPKTMFPGQVPEHSIEGQPSIDLTGVMNSESESNLIYNISITDYEQGKPITSDMLILLRLEFDVGEIPDDPDPLPEQYRGEYVKLNMGDVFPEPGNDDVFSRSADDDDDLLKQIEMMKVSLKNINNNIIDDRNLYILVSAKDNSDRTFAGIINFSDHLKGEDPYIILDNFDEKIFPNPFSPKFQIILKKDDGEDYATLRILQPPDGEEPAFDFNMAIELKTNIDYTIDLD